MAYELQLLLPKDTAKASPLNVELELQPGIITGVRFRFPRGCMYLVGGRIMFQSKQLYPINADYWFISNNETIVFEPDTLIDKAPYTLTLEGYNTDDTYQHALYLEIDMDFLDAQLFTTEDFMSRFMLSSFLPGVGQ